MRNSEKFKTAKERARAFSKWCNLTNGKDCLKIESCNLCAFKWLDLEAKEKGEKVHRREAEKKFEYAVRFDPSKSLYALTTDYAYAKRTMDDVNADGLTICKLVRREVGEWEEVPNEG